MPLFRLWQKLSIYYFLIPYLYINKFNICLSFLTYLFIWHLYSFITIIMNTTSCLSRVEHITVNMYYFFRLFVDGLLGLIYTWLL